MDKAKFLKEDYIPLLKKLKGDEKGSFGKLSPQGMIEHMCDAFGNVYAKAGATKKIMDYIQANRLLTN